MMFQHFIWTPICNQTMGPFQLWYGNNALPFKRSTQWLSSSIEHRSRRNTYCLIFLFGRSILVLLGTSSWGVAALVERPRDGVPDSSEEHCTGEVLERNERVVQTFTMDTTDMNPAISRWFFLMDSKIHYHYINIIDSIIKHLYLCECFLQMRGYTNLKQRRKVWSTRRSRQRQSRRASEAQKWDLSSYRLRTQSRRSCKPSSRTMAALSPLPEVSRNRGEAARTPSGMMIRYLWGKLFKILAIRSFERESIATNIHCYGFDIRLKFPNSTVVQIPLTTPMMIIMTYPFG